MAANHDHIKLLPMIKKYWENDMNEWELKFRYSEKATNIWKISHFVLTLLSNLPKKVGYFFTFCGLLTISELENEQQTKTNLKIIATNHRK